MTAMCFVIRSSHIDVTLVTTDVTGIMKNYTCAESSCVQPWGVCILMTHTPLLRGLPPLEETTFSPCAVGSC
jgi:hypothetical protein